MQPLFSLWVTTNVTSMQKTLHSEKYNAVFLALLRDARSNAKMTQQELATALGVDRTMVTKAESGVRRLDPIETFHWVRCLGTTFAAFSALLEDRLLAFEMRSNVSGRRPS